MSNSVEMLVLVGFNKLVNKQFTVTSTSGGGLSACFWSGMRYINCYNSWPTKRSAHGGKNVAGRSEARSAGAGPFLSQWAQQLGISIGNE